MRHLALNNKFLMTESGPSSPIGYSVVPSGSSRSPKIERKEFYSKASYTTMMKGTGGDVVDLPNFTTDEFPVSDFPALGAPSRPSGLESMSSSSETRKTYMTSSDTTSSRNLSNGVPPPSAIGAPLYTSTPMKPLTNSRSESSYTREVITDRSVTPPPQKVDPLKTPPMIRKILQSSQKDLSSTSHHHHHSSSSTTTHTSNSTPASKPPPVGGVPLPIIQSSNEISRTSAIHKSPSYDEPPERLGARYYTSTVTTEHREREVSPIRRFPSPQPPKGSGEPPKRLDELLASFEDSSYSVSTKRYSENGGEHFLAHIKPT